MSQSWLEPRALSQQRDCKGKVLCSQLGLSTEQSPGRFQKGEYILREPGPQTQSLAPPLTGSSGQHFLPLLCGGHRGNSMS